MADAFEKLAQQAEELVEKDATVAFDYEDAKSNKEARSYVYEARRLKGEVEAKRKEKTSSLLERKRAIDARAKAVMEPVQAVIDRHAAEIKRVEDAEKARQAALEEDLEQLRELGTAVGPDGRLLPSETIREKLQRLEGQNLTEDRFQEAFDEAENLRDMGLAVLRQELAVAERQEAERAELERLRREAAERERQALEDQRRREAEERQREKERKEQDERIQQLERQAEAERQRAERAAQEERERIEREQRDAVMARQQAEALAASEPEPREEKAGSADTKAADVLSIVTDDLSEVWDNAMSDTEDGAFTTLFFIQNVARRLIAGEAPSIKIVAEEATA